MLPTQQHSSRFPTQAPTASNTVPPQSAQESHEPVRIWWGNSQVHEEHETAPHHIDPTFRFGGAAGSALWFLAGVVARVHTAAAADVQLGTFVADVLSRARQLELAPVKVIATRYGGGFHLNPEFTEATSAAVRTGDVEVHLPINVGRPPRWKNSMSGSRSVSAPLSVSSRPQQIEMRHRCGRNGWVRTRGASMRMRCRTRGRRAWS